MLLALFSRENRERAAGTLSLKRQQKNPQRLRLDNGPELISKELAGWAAEKGILLDHIRPGKPAQNAYIERFNRTYREEVLDAYLFSSIEEVREITEQWLEEYNAVRPHAALGGVPPYQYAPSPA